MVGVAKQSWTALRTSSAVREATLAVLKEPCAANGGTLAAARYINHDVILSMD